MIQVVRNKNQVSLAEVDSCRIYLLEKNGSLWLLRPYQKDKYAWCPLYPVGTGFASEPQTFVYLLDFALNSNATVWEFESISEVYQYAARCTRGR